MKYVLLLLLITGAFAIEAHAAFVEPKDEGLEQRQALFDEAVSRYPTLRKALGPNPQPCLEDLIDIGLKNADLRGVTINSVDLSYVDLENANLSGAKILATKMIDANLFGLNFSGALLEACDLTDTNLAYATFENAELFGVGLVNSNISQTVFNGSVMSHVDFTGAEITYARFSGATLTDCALTETTFHPHASSGVKLGDIKGILTIHFDRDKQNGLVQMRNAFRDSGMREHEREATCRIMRLTNEYDSNWIEYWWKIVFFDHTVGYGLYPSRAMILLLLSIVIFTPIYTLPLSKHFKGSILRYRPAGRIEQADSEPLLSKEASIEPIKASGWRVLLLALYFSLLSAFRIGWREFNVGSWIARLQNREYTLVATGWAKSIAGFQSLISVYLLALWIMTYFGRPFG